MPTPSLEDRITEVLDRALEAKMGDPSTVPCPHCRRVSAAIEEIEEYLGFKTYALRS